MTRCRPDYMGALIDKLVEIRVETTRQEWIHVDRDQTGGPEFLTLGLFQQTCNRQNEWLSLHLSPGPASSKSRSSTHASRTSTSSHMGADVKVTMESS